MHIFMKNIENRIMKLLILRRIIDDFGNNEKNYMYKLKIKKKYIIDFSFTFFSIVFSRLRSSIFITMKLLLSV